MRGERRVGNAKGRIGVRGYVGRGGDAREE